MDLSSIISISGQSGLFKIVSQTNNGIIVEPLGGGRRFPVHGAQRVSSLEDISIYTYEEDVPLTEVFQKIFDGLSGKEAIPHKSSAEELKSFLNTHLPNFDEERVYNSDIKKLVQWYNILHKEGLLEKKSEIGNQKSEKGAEKKGSAKSADKKPKPKASNKGKAPAKKASPSVKKQSTQGQKRGG
tara:strand:- start:1448 stop:2002 length:555 start_codon:yes stop_codon:yes gene_type:complete